MKVAVTLLAALVAVATASGGFGYQARTREAYVNSVNGARQVKVNVIAEKVGASSGTFRKDGVPGANVHYAGVPHYDGVYHAGAYPVYGHGYPAYGHAYAHPAHY